VLTITQSASKEALHLATVETVGKHLRGVPFNKEGKARRYALAWVLPRLGRKYRPFASQLLQRAKPDNSGLYIGGDAELPHAKALCEWLEADPAMAARLAKVRQAFFSGLAASSRGVATFYNDAERLRVLIAAADDCLPYIITGDASGLPAFAGGYSRAIALIHHAGVEEVAA